MKYVAWKRQRRYWIGTVSTGEELFRIEQRKRPDGHRPARTTLLYRLPAGGAEVRRGVWSAKDHADNLARLANYPPFPKEAAA